ncbi:serine hydroxymethyltransferase [Candidatus Gracilibacteria bacterium]|nr:serine hydroxymethyltransferase [Candidatus Gracilibacteria bacterium]
MLQQTDPKLADMIAREANRQDTEIELIASENYVSKDVLEANGSILTNKYSEGYPGRRYYGGCHIIDEIETLAIDRAKELFGAEHVNVQPLSGSPANMAVYMGLLNPGDKVLGFSLDQGGHLSHGHPMNFSGILYEIIPYFLDKQTEEVDMDELERLAIETKPAMIIAGFSAYSRDLDWKRFREIADKVGAVLMADIAHIAGLIAAGIIENPVPYCDVVTTTTHKTLRGPRGGMIMCKQEHAKAIDRAVFPGLQGGPHENLIAAKAVAFGEALKPEFKDYQIQVVKNAQKLASELQRHGFKIVSGGTDNHLMLVDVFAGFEVTGKQAEHALEIVGLSTNKNMVPYDTRPPMNPSGIRIGTPAATTRGMGEDEMVEIADIFAQTIKNFKDEENLIKQRERVLKLCKQFPING